ncbi:MAG: ribbon-helix-helix protein, CopG family [Candidatus Helarchaeota archaeon]|nr:ribbon-helix-helix protein, CopG family [Candidatus Helarchaeota archaeon]
MVQTLNIEIDDDAMKKLKEMADKTGINISRMCRHILEEFTYQGKVYGGLWNEGPGKRILIDYPKYSSRVIKLTNAQLKG